MDLPVVKFRGEAVEFITPSWNDLQNLTFKLSEKIKSNKVKVDRIVTLAKGGWPMTRSLVDFLEIDKIASVGIKFYGRVNERLKRPYIYQNLPVTVYDERVLLFDDVADSGYSLKFATQYLLDNGVRQVVTATLFYKPGSKVKPDFFAYQTKAWIIFPYEEVETVKDLTCRWQGQGVSQTEIDHRLSRFGFKPRTKG